MLAVCCLFVSLLISISKMYLEGCLYLINVVIVCSVNVVVFLAPYIEENVCYLICVIARLVKFMHVMQK